MNSDGIVSDFVVWLVGTRGSVNNRHISKANHKAKLFRDLSGGRAPSGKKYTHRKVC